MSGPKSLEIPIFSNDISGSCSPAAQHRSAQLRRVTWRNIGSTGDSALPYTRVGRANEQIPDLQIPGESQNRLNWERAQRSASSTINLSLLSPAGSSSATSAGHSIGIRPKDNKLFAGSRCSSTLHCG